MPRTSRRVGRVEVFGSRKRAKGQFMGRFGGGWEYKLGLTATGWHPEYGLTVLVALWTAEYRIKIHPKGA